MSSIARTLRTAMVAIIGLAALAVVIAWLSGAFKEKVEPGRGEVVAAAIDAPVVEVEVRTVPRITRAVGTIRAVHETAVGSRLLAHVEKVHIVAGQAVDEGDVLIELDQADIEARQRRVQANLEAARARLSKAREDLDRVTKLSRGEAATQREVYDAQRAVEVAEADVNAAEQALAEAEAELEYATVRSPITGIVIEKFVEEGDLARRGETLVTLYQPDRLQLVAPVPERLALGLSVGDTVDVEIEAIGMRCHGQVSEIVPQASPASRSLMVKVTGPCPPNVLSGMFGRMLIAEGQRRQLLVPATAVRQVGQLEMVQVVTPPGDEEKDEAGAITRRRFVRTGERVDDKIEILAGLEPGERVLETFIAD
ncbi:MAG: efflux RND transporter periplasmic adaptor subunit [Planctomycetota bacterium]|nr:efflux RND transporter periplasmic adaptor subunit [Planctomycetota bacterium]